MGDHASRIRPYRDAAAVLDLRLGSEDATPLIGAFVERKIPLIVTTGFDVGAPQGLRVLTKPYRETDFIDALLEIVHRRG